MSNHASASSGLPDKIRPSLTQIISIASTCEFDSFSQLIVSRATRLKFCVTRDCSLYSPCTFPFSSRNAPNSSFLAAISLPLRFHDFRGRCCGLHLLGKHSQG